jgi:LmbE family N-acetylglucosaminyl deacetylase
MTDTSVDFRSIAGGRNLFVLTAAPGDESLFCGGLIAEACARGRPPFLAVLTDGSGIAIPGLQDSTPDNIAARHARETMRAAAILGIPDGWRVVLGLLDGTVPTSGTRFEALVDALAMITWRRDCYVVVVPWAADRRPSYMACHAIGVALAKTHDLDLVTYRTSNTVDGMNSALRLNPTPALARRAVALIMHPHITADFDEGYCPQYEWLHGERENTT